MKKAAIYARYSSDKQTEETIHVQVDKCKAFCESQGILVCGTFADKGKSGTTEGGREEYARMVEMAKQSLFDVIVAYKYDRLGRSFPETVRSIHELERFYNIEVYSATEPNDALVRNILLSVAENFSRQLAGRIFDSLSNTASRGFHCGGAAPYGYLRIEIPDPAGRTDHKGTVLQHVVFDLHPDQAPVVRRIFQEYGDGCGMKRITDALNKEGITAPGGGSWDLTAVRYILLNEAYRGWRIWNKTKKFRKPDGKKTYRHRPRKDWVIQKDAHPAIVDDALWAMAETARKRRERFLGGKGNHKTASSVYMLTGLIKCSECGGNFIMSKQRGANPASQYFYYRCNYHNRRGNAVCTNSIGLERDRLEHAVVDLLQREVLTKNTVQEIIAEVRKAWKDRQQEGPEQELGRVQLQLRKVERELVNLVQAVKTTGISETLKTELERCEKRKAALEYDLQELQQRRPQALSLPTEKEITAGLADLRLLLESGTPRERRTILEDNIEEILVQPTGETILKANPAGMLPLPDFPLDWCRRRESNPHAVTGTGF